MIKIIHTTVIIFILLGITSCRKEKYVNSAISDNYYYSLDSTKILYDGEYKLVNVQTPNYKEVPADVKSFRPISADFAKDTSHVFYTNVILMNVHRRSFYWDNINKLPKDRYHVYLPITNSNMLTIIRYADPQTYEKVDLGYDCLFWYRDRNHYFYNHKLTLADRTSLNFTCPLLPYDNQQVFYLKYGQLESRRYNGSINVINNNMLYDDKCFYASYECDSTSCAVFIDYKDKDSLHFFDDDMLYFSIDSSIYYKGRGMAADLSTFRVLNKKYSMDRSSVYYEDNSISGSDPATFRILNDKYAKDRYQVYQDGRVLPQYKPVSFISDKWGRYPADSDYGEELPKKRKVWGN